MSPNPNEAFIDTNIFAAVRDSEDPTHKKAIKLFDYIEKNSIQLFTSSDVIGETVTLLSRKLGKEIAKDWFYDYQKSGIVEIFIDSGIHAKARDLFFSTKSKNITFIDCSCVIAMKKNKIEYAFTFDKHFKKLGAKLLSEIAK